MHVYDILYLITGTNCIKSETPNLHSSAHRCYLLIRFKVHRRYIPSKQQGVLLTNRTKHFDLCFVFLLETPQSPSGLN